MRRNHSEGRGLINPAKFQWPQSLAAWREIRKLVQDRLAKLSLLALGSTAPNPPVAALAVILLPDRQILYMAGGMTEPPGKRHAEIVCLDALDRLSQDLQDQGVDLFASARIHLYVTLEPCTTHGRTPPCVDRITKYANIKKVTFFSSDPNLKVSANTILSRSGIKVSGPCARKGLNIRSSTSNSDLFITNPGFALAGFFHRLQGRRPRLHIKIACTSDGVMGLRDRRLRISGSRALSFGMRLRAHLDAVLTGAGTIACDGPSLNLRMEAYREHPLTSKHEPHSIPELLSDKQSNAKEGTQDPSQSADSLALLEALLQTGQEMAAWIREHMPWYEPKRLFLLGREWEEQDAFFAKQRLLAKKTEVEARYYARSDRIAHWTQQGIPVAPFPDWPTFLEGLSETCNELLIEAGPGLLRSLEPHLGQGDLIYILRSKKGLADFLPPSTKIPTESGMEKTEPHMPVAQGQAVLAPASYMEVGQLLRSVRLDSDVLELRMV